MRNELRAGNGRTACARLLLASVIAAASVALAEDTTPPPAQPAPAEQTSDKPASPPAATQAPAGKVVDEDYEKNSAKRFTPTERTPADRNVSFPSDI